MCPLTKLCFSKFIRLVCFALIPVTFAVAQDLRPPDSLHHHMDSVVLVDSGFFGGPPVEQVYEYNSTGLASTCSWGVENLPADYFRARYNTATRRFRWEVKFAPNPSTGALPEGFFLVLNDGPIPRGNPGQYAIFYFDATNPGSPVLTVYGYSGGNPGQSWIDGSSAVGIQAPDRIRSSLLTSDWFSELSTSTDGVGHRTYVFEVDAAVFQNHTPLYPDPMGPWYGVGFGPQIGFWFHAMEDLFPTYSAGYLTDFSYVTAGNYDCWDYDLQRTNSQPLCVGPSNLVAQFGQPLQANFVGSDPDCTENGGDPQFCGLGHALTVNYGYTENGSSTSAPSGSVENPANGSSGASPLASAFSWTPGIADFGRTININVTYTDPQALQGACSAQISVPPNNPPYSNPGEGYVSSCTGVQTVISLDGSNSGDPENMLLNYLWTTNCPNATLENATSANASLRLLDPGLGIPAACSVTLTVDDGLLQASNSATITVPACPLDCLNVPNGQAQLDQCGVCNGNNACFDCAGVKFGTSIVDRCGVCGGQDACVDCAGTPFGALVQDRCNVCGGNGQSCLGCSDTNITPTLVALDSNAGAQRTLVRRAAKEFVRLSRNSRSARRFADSTRAAAEALYSGSWNLTWSIATINSTCSNTTFCVQSSSNGDKIVVYVKNANGLNALLKRVTRKLKRIHGGEKIARSLERAGGRELTESLAIANAVPKISSLCS